MNKQKINFFALLLFLGFSCRISATIETIEKQVNAVLTLAEEALATAAGTVEELYFIRLLNSLIDANAGYFMALQNISLGFFYNYKISNFLQIDFSHSKERVNYTFDLGSQYKRGHASMMQRANYILAGRPRLIKDIEGMKYSTVIFYYILPYFFCLPEEHIDPHSSIQNFANKIRLSREYDALLNRAQIISAQYKILLESLEDTAALAAKDHLPVGGLAPARMSGATLATDCVAGSSAPSTQSFGQKILSSRGSSPAGSDSDESRKTFPGERPAPQKEALPSAVPTS